MDLGLPDMDGLDVDGGVGRDARHEKLLARGTLCFRGAPSAASRWAGPDDEESEATVVRSSTVLPEQTS